MRPYLSVLIVISMLLTMVFLQMEERRMGYEVLKLSKEVRRELEQKRNRTIALAKVTRPQNVERIAQSQFTLQQIRKGQIIHISSASWSFNK